MSNLKLYNGKWDGIWDKPKYQRIRQKIWKAFEGIEFVEETHQYFYKGKELTPTSNVCHLFRLPFDEDVMAEHCERKYHDKPDSKYFGMTKNEILDSWHAHSKRSTDHGTLIHLFGENCAYFMMRQYDKLTDDFKKRIVREEDGREYISPNEPKEEAVVKFWNDLPVSIIPIVFEIQMFSLKYGISGTADLLFLHDPHIEQDDNDEEISKRLYLMDYKGLPMDTPMLTENGWKEMKDLTIHDKVYDADGELTSVINISKKHDNPCVRIKFTNGESVVCDKEHKWLITPVNSLEMRMGDDLVMTAEKLAYSVKEGTFSGYGIKMNKAVDQDTVEMRKREIISIMDDVGTYRVGRFIAAFPSGDERIERMKYLLASLGIYYTYTERRVRSYIEFKCDFTPFNRRVKKRMPVRLDDEYYRIIESVEEVDSVPTRCIEVDSPTHTYLCGNNLLITHNTNADLYKSFGNMLEPFADMMDCDLSGYKLQAAIYSKFLMDLGFGFVARCLIWLIDNGDGTGSYEKVKMESLVNVLFNWLDKNPGLIEKH